MKLRAVSPFVAALVLAMTFSSCTCSSSTPEVPPPSSQAGSSRRESFGQLKVKERQAPEVARGVVTPDELQARAAPTLPAAPEAKLPDDFPSDVPVYQGAEIAGVQDMPHDGHNVIFTFDKATEPDDVFAFYKNDMAHNGWKTEQELESKENLFLSFKKGETITNVVISRDPRSGRRVVSVMYYREKPLPFNEF